MTRPVFAYIDKLAGPGGGVIPDRVRADAPANPRAPRRVVINRMAEGDLVDLPDGDEKKARQMVKAIERGEVELERKSRHPLQDCFSADVTPSLRLLMFPHIDGTWQVFYAGYHDYEEAERRMASLHTASTIRYAYEPSGTWHTINAYDGGTKVGTLELDQPEPGVWQVVSIEVKPEYRRRGIGSGLNAYALEHATKGAPIQHAGDSMSDLGRALFDSLSDPLHHFDRTAAASGCRYQHPEHIAAAERVLEMAKDQPKESRREHMRSIANGAVVNIRKAMETCPDCSDASHMIAALGALEVAYSDGGKYGRRDHITMGEKGTIPTEVVRNMPGQMGEVPGDHRNKKGEVWEEFKRDLSENGMNHGIFICISPGEPIRIWEGNHRRDAAVELGWKEIPCEIRYFGLAEQDGTLMERYAKGGRWMDGYVDKSRIKATGAVGPSYQPFCVDCALERGFGPNDEAVPQRPGVDTCAGCDRTKTCGYFRTGFNRDASSWRALVSDAYWDAYDVTISSDGGPSGRKAYEIHVGGKPFANRPSLTEAKEAVEKLYGIQQWRTVRTDKMVVDHYHFGETTEFTAPTTIWVADLA